MARGKQDIYWDKALRLPRRFYNIDEFYSVYPTLSVIQSFKEILPNSLSGKRLLDAGCGYGFYFNYFSRIGVANLFGVVFH